MKFTDTNIDEKILKALDKLGFTDMTPVQEQTYPIIHSGKDLCALAETGSGKTAACAIPLIEKIEPEKSAIQGLVIVPTRELCIQYVDEIGMLAEFTHVKPFAIYGGFSKEIQMAKINHEVHVLVATPGRLIDLIYDGAIDFTSIKMVILDEADELLKEGFLDDIKFILSCIRTDHQTLLFSATMPQDIKKLAQEYFREPEEVTLISKQASPKSLTHCFQYVHPKDKLQELLKLLETENAGQAIIFCNARQGVDDLHRDLKKKMKDVDYIHAGLTQDKRSSLFRQFKNKKIRVLIATDVAGRGLDFSHVTHVVNWDYPRSNEQYMHRTGRSGRMGRDGKAITFISKRDLGSLRKLFQQKKINAIWLGKNPLDPNAPQQKAPHQDGKGNEKSKKKPYHGKDGGQKKKPYNAQQGSSTGKPKGPRPDQNMGKKKTHSPKPAHQKSGTETEQIYIKKKSSGKPSTTSGKDKKPYYGEKKKQGGSGSRNRNNQQNNSGRKPQSPKPQNHSADKSNRPNKPAADKQKNQKAAAKPVNKQEKKPGFFKRIFGKKEKQD